MWHLLIEPVQDEIPGKTALLTDVKVRSLDAASALLHMLSQTIVSESDIHSVTLFNSNDNEKKEN